MISGRWQGESWGVSYFMVSGKSHVLVIVQIDFGSLGAVYDVGNGQPIAHDAVVITVIVDNEDALAVFVVRADEPTRGTEPFRGELGDGAFGEYRHDV